MTDIHADRILILDFGSQYTQLIARRVRELGVYCEIHPWDAGDAAVREFAPRGIILSGGPESVTVAESVAVTGSIASSACTSTPRHPSCARPSRATRAGARPTSTRSTAPPRTATESHSKNHARCTRRAARAVMRQIAA